MAITIDEMLDLLSFAGTELVNGNANHGPMAAEALFTLGREEAVLPWVDGYRDRLLDRPTPAMPIPPADWREYLGHRDRLGDWIQFFEHRLAEDHWTDVLKEWAPRLTPAIMAAATHGLIRTAHAARSLASEETPQRLYELAQGLGYWAARYYTLPGIPSPASGNLSPADALGLVGRLHGPDFDGSGPIIEQVKGLVRHPEFGPVIDLVDTGDSLSRSISNLTETFAGVYLANTRNLIAFVHSVTAPSALRLVAPYMTKEDATLAARYAWQACAAVYAWYSVSPPPDPSLFQQPDEDVQDLVDRAVSAGGAHSIKFTEACLREYAARPSPVYLAAAKDVSERVGPI